MNHLHEAPKTVSFTVPFLISCALESHFRHNCQTVTQCNRILPPIDNKQLITVVTDGTDYFLHLIIVIEPKLVNHYSVVHCKVISTYKAQKMVNIQKMLLQ